MKVAIQIANYYPIIGGAEIFTQYVAEHLVKKRHSVDVISVRRGNLPRYERINGVNVYRVNYLRVRYLRFLTFFPSLIWQTVNLDRRKNYDIIHSVCSMAIEAGALTSKLCGKKHLITAQGGGDLLEYVSQKSILDGLRKCLINYSLRNANLVHAVSAYMKEKAKQLGAKEVTVIPNGVDTSKFKPMNKQKLREKYGYSQQESIIVSTSRLTPKNGIPDLIKAAARVSQEFPDIRLIIIGDGVQRPELERLIHELRLESKVELLGSVPNAQIPKYLNMADLFVRPALAEGFGISFIEAMACHIPVIGSSVGGILDIIEDESNGFMVTPGDVNDIAQKIVTLLSNKELSQKLADEGYKTVQEKFTWAAVLKQFDSLYERLR
ncbi:glycosyltransferase family 4 protein [Chloroflexota bacterium]